jgi:hypothetical protein
MAVQKTASGQRRVKPADVGTQSSNKRTARLLAQAKKQGQANNPRITARELENIITKTGSSDAFLKQTGAMASLKNDLGPKAKEKYNRLVADYANRNRRTGDDTPQAPAGMSPVIPGEPRSSELTPGAYASQTAPRSDVGAYASQMAPRGGLGPTSNPAYAGLTGRAYAAIHGRPNPNKSNSSYTMPSYTRFGDDTPQAPAGMSPVIPGEPRSSELTPGELRSREDTYNSRKFLNRFIGVSPTFRNIGNPDVQVEGMSVGNIRMRR